MTTGTGRDVRRHQSGGSGPNRPSGRELRAAAQRQSTLRSARRRISLADRLREPIVEHPAPWRPVAALVLSLAGLGVSVYLTIDHFAKIPLACSESGIVNCQKVTTSAQSHFLGVPVAVLGLAFFVAMTAANLPAAWRSEDRRIHLARLALAVLGICFVLYLVAAEFLIIGNICLWCTSVHVLTFLLLVLLVSTTMPMLGWGTGEYATD